MREVGLRTCRPGFLLYRRIVGGRMFAGGVFYEGLLMPGRRLTWWSRGDAGVAQKMRWPLILSHQRERGIRSHRHHLIIAEMGK